MSDTIELWQHQLDGIEFALEKRRSILAYDMRTGKTLTSLFACIANKSERILVIAPSSTLVHVWEETVREHTNFQVLCLHKISVNKRIERLQAFKNGVVVINYEVVFKMFRALREHKFDTLISDEAHRLKGNNTKVTRAVTKLAKDNNLVMLLTGTPFHNSPLDVFSLARICNPTLFDYVDNGQLRKGGTAWTHFRNRYAKLEPVYGKKHILKVVGYQRLDEMDEKLSTIMKVVRREDVMEILPTEDVPLHLKMSTEGRAYYKEFEKEAILTVGDDVIIADNVLVRTLKLRQILSGVLPDSKRTVVSKHKIDALLEIVSSTDRPVVVFVWFKNSTDHITDVLQNKGYRTGKIDGRGNDYKKWANGNLDVLIVQMQSGSEGLDLTLASYAVYYELPYSLGVYEQSKARLQGSNQTVPVSYFYLLSRTTLEPVVYQSLLKKQDITLTLLNEIKRRNNERN